MKLSIVLLSLFIPSLLMAQEDTYHLNLRNTLQTQYGLAGGTWVFLPNEATNAANITAGGGEKSVINITGQPFTKAVQVAVTTIPTNPWNAGLDLFTTNAVASGDRLLLVFWARTLSSSRNNIGFGVFEFMLKASPYTKFRLFDQRIGTEWKQYIIPVQVTQDIAATAGKFTVELGAAAQTIQIGGVTAINYKQTYPLSVLPRLTNDEYVGMESNAPWRALADARIEQYRKANLDVSVLGSTNQPINNVQVKIEMLRHDFAWGTAIQENRIVSTNASYNPTYTDKLLNLDGKGHGFNTVVLENGHKWVQWENIWPLSHADNAKMVNWLKTKLVDVRGHTLIWPGWSNSPADLATNQTNLPYLTTRINTHLAEMLNFPGLKGIIKEWDVINEPVGNVDIANAFRGSTGYPTGREIYRDIFNKVKQIDPSVRRFLNENPFCSSYAKDSTYESYIKQIISDGATIDGIGIQSHFNFMIPPEELYQTFTRLHNLTNGKIRMTEYDNNTLAADTLHRDYFRDLLTVAFSHPQCDGFLMWGFWSGTSWKSPIFNTDWTVKTSGKPFIDLVFDKWWTPTTTKNTNNVGKINLRGFKGLYKITLTHGSEQKIDTVRLTTDSTFTYHFNVTPTNDFTATNIHIYPNPSNVFFTIERDNKMPCTVRLYNTTGQVMRIITSQEESIKVDTRGLSKGIYIVEVQEQSQLYKQKININ